MIKQRVPRQHPKKISRRSLLEAGLAGAGALIAGGLSPASQANSASYNGKLLVTLQLEGGVDVTQLCDPKINMPGEKKSIIGLTVVSRCNTAISHMPRSH